MTPIHGPSNRRRADASHNDQRILAAAREVFTELGPDAPMLVIAERAGVGMGTLYRCYPSKDDLMRALTIATIEQTRQEAETALAALDAWAGFTQFIHRCVEAGVDGSPRLTGTFEVTEEVLAASKRAREAIQAVLDRARAEGGLRPDVNAADIALLLGVLRMQRAADQHRSPDLRQRFVAIVLDGLRAANAQPLPVPPWTWPVVEAAWRSLAKECRANQSNTLHTDLVPRGDHEP
ncbi:MAG: TetR/AcrR family transcriptional regulator [Chloroflexi bacterium]|nr:TetR/AcrR family transcriptional regulator [Chloroflexota bacterium]